ncbi:MAG: phosphohydrolase [Synergistaceae bacterium]|jgi:nanoRNase/pAp phosphatase (c-di-AMP/oligoRNAs hydrolase)|nr:phosphohydrolase [Synergistaceae bacterium]
MGAEYGIFHIISHTDLDGVAAAALAWRAAYHRGSPIRLTLSGYGEVDNAILEAMKNGDGMTVIDLSPQFQATVDEIDRTFIPGSPPFIFDHHKSTFEKYANRPWIVADVDYCGAMVYWNWLHSGNADGETLAMIEPLRHIVRVANDRDLWINEDPDGRLWQAMVTLCGEWGALSRLIANPSAVFTDSERAAVTGFVRRQEERFKRAKEHLARNRSGRGDFLFLGDGFLEFGDTSDFCGMLLDRPDSAEENAPILVALAYRKPGGGWAVSLRSRSGLAGRVVSLLKDGRKIRGGGHLDAAALYFPKDYNESGIRESISAALSAQSKSASGMGVTLGDLFKGSM